MTVERSDSTPFVDLTTGGIKHLQPYQPGKPIDELQRELCLPKVTKLASNENPLGPSKLALSAINKALKELCLYPDGSGYRLKQRLSQFLSVPVASITLGNGSNDVLELIARAFANADSEIIFSQHAFAVYPIVTQAIGAKAVVTPAKNWGHDLSAMSSAVTDKTAVIFLANPNNPTGTWFALSALRSFLESIPSAVVVVLDEAYCEYIHEDVYPNGLDFLEQYSNLVVTRTFSKAWGLASLRVGYAISNPEIADILNRIRQPFNVNSMALAAAEAVLDDTDYLQRGIKVNDEGKAQIEQGLKTLKLEFIPSVGNFISFNVGDGISASNVNDALLKQGVIVRPVENYGMAGYLRVSIGLSEENQHFLDALAQVLDSTHADKES